MQQAVARPHRLAWRICLEKPVQVLALLCFQVLVRAFAFLPFLLAAATGRFLSFNPDHAPAWGLVFSLPLYVILVMPFRFQAKARMAQLHGLPYESRISFSHYWRWLKAALVRLVLVLPALIPLGAFCYLFYYYMRVPGFNDSLLVINNLGALVGGSYVEGILLIAAFALLSLVLAGWSWLRGLPFEHQDIVSQGIALSMKKAGVRLREQKKALHRVVFRNMLLFLPAFFGVLAILILQSLSMPLMGSLAFDFIIIVSVFLTLNFPSGTLLMLLVVLLVLWLPLLPLRKLALSAVLAEEPGTSSEA